MFHPDMFPKRGGYSSIFSIIVYIILIAYIIPHAIIIFLVVAIVSFISVLSISKKLLFPFVSLHISSSLTKEPFLISLLISSKQWPVICHCCILLFHKETMHQCGKNIRYTTYTVLNSSNSR